MTIDEQIEGYLLLYLEFYEATGLLYDYRIPAGKKKSLTIGCGESSIKFKVDKTLDDYEEFVKQAIKQVTIMEQERLRDL